MNNSDIEKEYITIERCVYDSMKYRLYNFENPKEDIFEKIKNYEGVCMFKSTIGGYLVGFSTIERFREELDKYIKLQSKYEKLPKFVKYLINKL